MGRGIRHGVETDKECGKIMYKRKREETIRELGGRGGVRGICVGGESKGGQGEEAEVDHEEWNRWVEAVSDER